MSMGRYGKKAVILSLLLCMLAACGNRPEATPEREAETVEEPETSGKLREVNMDIEDAMSTSQAKDLEFIIIRIKDEYFDIRRDGQYLRLHDVYTSGTDYPELEEGTCARVVADVDIVDGGIAGYLHDYFLKDVKSCVPLTYDEVAAELELRDAGETNISMYDHVLIYHYAGSSYLFCAYRDKNEAYKDGEFFAEYDDEIIEGLNIPEPFLKDVDPGFSADPFVYEE